MRFITALLGGSLLHFGRGCSGGKGQYPLGLIGTLRDSPKYYSTYSGIGSPAGYLESSRPPRRGSEVVGFRDVRIDEREPGEGLKAGDASAASPERCLPAMQVREEKSGRST